MLLWSAYFHESSALQPTSTLVPNFYAASDLVYVLSVVIEASSFVEPSLNFPWMGMEGQAAHTDSAKDHVLQMKF